MSLEKAAREVLCHFPLTGVRIVSLGNRGGFSGASLWQIKALSGAYCLRAWPANGITGPRLADIHRLMQKAKDLGFVPQPVAGRHYLTVFHNAGRVWDLTTWMPGVADFWSNPTIPKIEVACAALALLHLAWMNGTTVPRPPPAVQRRLARWRAWQDLLERGWTLRIESDDPVRPWAERAWRQLTTRMATIPARLSAVQTSHSLYAVPLQPCLCDVWHDHVLFTGDNVTGLIDYGSVKTDNVSVDLARMLGSMVGDDAALREAGLAAYDKIRPLRREELDLIPVLDETGTVLAAANWLRWLYHDERSYPDRAAVAERLAALVRRMEGWPFVGQAAGLP